jgi:hypothetical protein
MQERFNQQKAQGAPVSEIICPTQATFFYVL